MMKDVVGSMGSGLLGLHFKDMLRSLLPLELANLGRGSPFVYSKASDVKTPKYRKLKQKNPKAQLMQSA